MAFHGNVEGQRIVAVRGMTEAEKKFEGWEDEPDFSAGVVLVLENGVRLYPAQDEEGNGIGALFGREKNSTFVLLPK